MASLSEIIDVHSHPILPLSRHVAIAIENAVMSDELQRPKDITRSVLLEAMDDTVIARGRLDGIYERK